MAQIQTALDFIDGASRATEMDALRTLLKQALEHYGVTHFNLIGLVREQTGARTPVSLMAPVDPAWAAYYQGEGFYNVDAVLHAVLRRPEGVTWAEVEARPMSRAARDLFGECRSALRVQGGLAVPTYDAAGFAGAVGMFFAEPQDAERMRALKLIGHFAMERAKELHGLFAHDGAPCPLTAQQREILAYSAQGKSDWDMGELTGLSHKTVNHHFERAKAKLGVRTRAQAVALAVRHGWIAIG
ncbi:MAG TPA: autoinducer binding domain-containing protein [Caulobacterales bacterium]|nr:autoinducer binding domain-containing protein [Caulobacterales bacterium]